MVQILQDKKKLGAVFVGLMIIGIVSLTLPTHISDADNAEFVAIGLYGGIAHPPGYPLYVLGLRLFSVFSGLFASPVTALSLFSTLCLGGGGVLFFRFLNRFGMPLWICVMASLWIFLSLPLWRMGNFVEPFGLHFLLVVAILFQIQTIVRKETPLTVMVLGLFWGFGFCNHHTLIFIAPMVLCLAFLKSRTMQAWLSLGLFFMLGFVIGLAPIVTFFTADNGLSWTWGDWSEPWARLFAHLFRTEYGTFQLVPHQSVTSLMGWQAFFKSLPDGLGFVGLAAVVLGLVLGWKELKNKAQRLWFVGHVICFAGYFVVFLAPCRLERMILLLP